MPESPTGNSLQAQLARIEDRLDDLRALTLQTRALLFELVATQRGQTSDQVWLEMEATATDVRRLQAGIDVLAQQHEAERRAESPSEG